MKGLPTLVVIFMISCITFAQNDSQILLQKIENEKVDSLKVNLYNELSSDLIRRNLDSAIQIAKQSVRLAERIDFKNGLAYAYKNVGMGYFYKGEYTDALINWEKSLEVFESLDSKIGISNLQSNIGAVYQTKGDDPNALKYFINSMRNATQIKDTVRMATAYLNMGTVYSNEAPTYSKALESYEQSMAMFNAIDYTEGGAFAALNIGELLLKQDKPIEALTYLEQAKQSYESIDGDLSVTLRYMGEAYMKLGQLDKSLEALQQSIEMADRRDSKMEKTISTIQLGKLNLEKKDFTAAINNFNEALLLTNTTQVLRDKRDAYEGLAAAYSKMGDYQKAYSYQLLYSETKDSISDEQYAETLGNLRFEFDIENKERQIELLNTENELKETQIANEENSRKLLYALLAILAIIIIGFTLQYRYVKKSHKRLDKERTRAENILLNILPKETADELKEKGFIKAKQFESVTVLFTDFKQFSVVAENISPERLVRSVDYYFKKFDEIIEKHSLEKIKTIGDAYMCAGGLPSVNNTHPEDAVRAAQDIIEFVRITEESPPEDIYPFKVRVGINTGQVIAGVVGTKKFQYDIWGNSVNVAARMESNCEPGRINVSENTYELLKDKHHFSYRGKIEVKNGLKLKMYYLENQPNQQSA